MLVLRISHNFPDVCFADFILSSTYFPKVRYVVNWCIETETLNVFFKIN